MPELANIVKWGHSAGLKLKNNAALTEAADNVVKETLRLLAKNDGSKLAGLDPMIPKADKYKGEPPK